MSDLDTSISADTAPTSDTGSGGLSESGSGLSEAAKEALSPATSIETGSDPETPAGVDPEAALAASQAGLAATGRPAKDRFELEMAQGANLSETGISGFEMIDPATQPILVQEVLEPEPGAGPAEPEIDWGLISQLEGGAQLEGYVPDPTGSQSGVTIATGFDIGQRSEAELENLFGADNPLVELLSPYTEMTRQEAVDFLAENPLSITAEQAAEIDAAAKADALADLVADYNGAVGPNGTQFAELPAAAQTVIASVAFQYGDLPTATPSFWNDAVTQDWEGMIGELRDFGDSYPTRRNTEADYLEERL